MRGSVLGNGWYPLGFLKNCLLGWMPGSSLQTPVLSPIQAFGLHKKRGQSQARGPSDDADATAMVVVHHSQLSNEDIRYMCTYATVFTFFWLTPCSIEIFFLWNSWGKVVAKCCVPRAAHGVV